MDTPSIDELFELGFPTTGELDVNDDICCGVDMETNSESYTCCFQCGKIGEQRRVQQTYAQSLETTFVRKTHYKRNDYFNTLLNQIQCNILVHVKPSVIKLVREQIYKSGIEVLNVVEIRKILKRLNLQKYYSVTNYIYYQVTNTKPKSIPPETIEKLNETFNKIQNVYETIKGNRKNSLPYKFIIIKLFQINNLHYMIPYVQVLKSRELTKRNEQIWSEIQAIFATE